MGQKKIPVRDFIIPPRDQRICGTICVRQMTLVLSSAALVFLTVAVYMPTTRAFHSGIGENPLMCTTTRNTNLTFQNCTNSAIKTCYGIDQDRADKARCIMDECKNLTGTFNCTEGQCLNITDAFECVFHNTGESYKCSGTSGKITCMDIEGLFSCNRGTCKKIITPYNCDRRCVDIPTRNKNIVILSGDNVLDKVYVSQCQNAINSETQKEVWNESADNVVMVSCFLIKHTSDQIQAVNCINGTVLDINMWQDLTNFTYLNYMHVALGISVPEIAPPVSASSTVVTPCAD